MRRQRFAQVSLVEAVMLGLIAILVVGAGISVGVIRREDTALGASAASSASPAGAATPAVGDVIPLPSSSSLSGGLTLVRTDKTPDFSEQEAIQIVHDFGVPVGEVIRGGKPVTCSVTYGIGTLGRSGGPGLPWWGSRNVPLKGTDVILDHVENRPMWIVDCDNAFAAGSQAIFKHAVNPVDEQTRSVLMAWFYDQVPSSEVPGVPGS